MQGKSTNTTPVKEGDEIDVTIEAVGGKGDGIAKVDGFIIFVPNTKKDDIVRIKITKVLKNVGFGEVIGSIKQDEPEPEDTDDFGEDDE